MIRPEVLLSTSKTIRPGVAETISLCLRGIPAACRSSRESTIRFDASSLTVVFMPLVWRGYGVIASYSNSAIQTEHRSVNLFWRRMVEPRGFEPLTS